MNVYNLSNVVSVLIEQNMQNRNASKTLHPLTHKTKLTWRIPSCPSFTNLSSIFGDDGQDELAEFEVVWERQTVLPHDL